MKVQYQTREMKKLKMVAIFIAIFTLVHILPVKTSNITVENKPTVAQEGNENENIGLKPVIMKTSKTVLTEMEENPLYWNDYLQEQLQLEGISRESVSGEKTESLEELEHNSTYWADYLKDKIDSEAHETIVNKMVNDPYYWKHYLDEISCEDSL